MKLIKIKTDLVVYRLDFIIGENKPFISMCSIDCDLCVIENVCASWYHGIRKLKIHEDS